MTLGPLQATDIGAEAQGALRHGRSGRIEAAFERSFYVRFDEDWICVGDPTIGRGPLNLLIDGSVSWLSVEPEAPCILAGHALRIGAGVLDLGSARVWHAQPPAFLSPVRVSRGLDALEAALGDCAGMQGLGDFVRSTPKPAGPTAIAAAPAIKAISLWLAAPAPTPPPESAVGQVLGLGPGLTPSGDDFLAGILAALRLIGADVRANLLWTEVARQAPRATSPLSAAHLRAADRCGLCEAVHNVLCAVIEGRTGAIASALAVLGTGGSTSPFDALAGCSTVLRGATGP